LKAQWQLE
jgi:putative transposase